MFCWKSLARTAGDAEFDGDAELLALLPPRSPVSGPFRFPAVAEWIGPRTGPMFADPPPAISPDVPRLPPRVTAGPRFIARPFGRRLLDESALQARRAGLGTHDKEHGDG